MKKLENCYVFEKQTEALMNFFFPKKDEEIIFEEKEKEHLDNENDDWGNNDHNVNNDNLSNNEDWGNDDDFGNNEHLVNKKVINYKINDDYYFQVVGYLKIVRLIKYNKNDINIVYELNIHLNKELYSISSSKEKKQIYICLLKPKKVIIFNYDIESKIITLSEDSIIDLFAYNNHFNKCISISKEYLATADKNSIIIWYRDNKLKDYKEIKKISLNTKIADLLSINDKYFISATPIKKVILFFNVNNLKLEKIISDIEVINNKDCLLLFKEYIIVSCEKGMAIIMIKTKELIQFVEFKYLKFDKIIFFCNDIIYVAYYNLNHQVEKNYYNVSIKIYLYKIIEGLLENYKNYKEIKIKIKNIGNDNDIIIKNKITIFCMNETHFIISGKTEHIFKEYNKMKDAKDKFLDTLINAINEDDVKDKNL